MASTRPHARASRLYVKKHDFDFTEIDESISKSDNAFLINSVTLLEK